MIINLAVIGAAILSGTVLGSAIYLSLLEDKMNKWEIVVVRNGSKFVLHENLVGYFAAYSWALEHVRLHGGIVQSIKEAL